MNSTEILSDKNRILNEHNYNLLNDMTRDEQVYKILMKN